MEDYDNINPDTSPQGGAIEDDAPLVKLPPPHLVNGVPISFASDGSDDDEIGKMIEKSTNPDDEDMDDKAAPPPPPPVERRSAPRKRVPQVTALPTPPPPQPSERPRTTKALTGNNAINLFKQAVGAGVIPVRIYSTGKDVLMRELTVTDQKTLSKTALINNNRRDVLYNAQNTLINSCVQTKDFDICDCTEFDRIVILLRLYQQNYFTNDIHYTCPSCGKENVYKLDFTKILDRIQKAWVQDKIFVMKHVDKEFHFTVGWPKVQAVSEFYTSYYKQYQKANEKTQNTIDQLSNVEYLIMFIRKIGLYTDAADGLSLDLDDYSYDERADLIDSLPQGLVFDDDNGIISQVISDFTDPLNKAFRYEKCQFCGAETEEGIGSIADFT